MRPMRCIDKKEREELDSLKIGSLLYQYTSHIGVPRHKDFLCYTFYEITGETKCYWILNNGFERARKLDLKQYKGLYNFKRFYMMDNETWEQKRLLDEHRKNQSKKSTTEEGKK